MKKATFKRKQWGIPGDVEEYLWMHIVDRDDTRPLVEENYPNVCKVKTKNLKDPIISGWGRECNQSRKPDY